MNEQVDEVTVGKEVSPWWKRLVLGTVIVLAGVFGAGAAVVTPPPPPAAAASSCNLFGTCWWGITYTYSVFWSPGYNECGPWVSTNDTPGGSACFQHNGDKFFVEDESTNGMRVGVEWKIGDGRWGMCVNKQGNGGKCDYSFGETSQGRAIVYRIGECDGTVNTCGKPGTGAGWVGWGAWSTGHI